MAQKQPRPVPMTEEERIAKAAEILAKKRESMFVGILYNIMNAGNLLNEEPKEIVRFVNEVTEEAMMALYNIPRDKEE